VLNHAIIFLVTSFEIYHPIAITSREELWWIFYRDTVILKYCTMQT